MQIIPTVYPDPMCDNHNLDNIILVQRERNHPVVSDMTERECNPLWYHLLPHLPTFTSLLGINMSRGWPWYDSTLYVTLRKWSRQLKTLLTSLRCHRTSRSNSAPLSVQPLRQLTFSLTLSPNSSLSKASMWLWIPSYSHRPTSVRLWPFSASVVPMTARIKATFQGWG